MSTEYWSIIIIFKVSHFKPSLVLILDHHKPCGWFLFEDTRATKNNKGYPGITCALPAVDYSMTNRHGSKTSLPGNSGLYHLLLHEIFYCQHILPSALILYLYYVKIWKYLRWTLDQCKWLSVCPDTVLCFTDTCSLNSMCLKIKD